MGKILGHYLMPHPPLLIPEVGGPQAQQIKATMSSCLEIATEISKLKPKTIIMITPHGPLFKDVISLAYDEEVQGDFRQFGDNDVVVRANINKDLTNKISIHAKRAGISTAKVSAKSARIYNVDTVLDHGAMVPLYYINRKYTNYKLVNITYGMLSKLDLYKFGMAIKNLIDEEKEDVVVIASGDLSHTLSEEGPYGYHEDGEKFDELLTYFLKNGKVTDIFNMSESMIENSGQCALRSLYIMLGMMNDTEIKGELMSYEAPYGIGYGVMSFKSEKKVDDMYEEVVNSVKEKFEEKNHHLNPYIRLARQSVVDYIEKDEVMEVPDYVTEEMNVKKNGVFVSLKKDGELRGCIGNIISDKSIAENIINNAIASAFKDNRFSEVRKEELIDIVFSVDIIHEAVEAKKEDLDPQKYGIIVQTEIKSGVLLPNLPQVKTVEEQLHIALNKAGIANDEEYTIFKFEVTRHVE